MKKLILIFAGLSLLPLVSNAQEEIIGTELDEFLEEELVVVASAKPTTIFNAPSTVSVIDEQMFQQYNFTSITEVLNIISGFSLQRSYLKSVCGRDQRSVLNTNDIIRLRYFLIVQRCQGSKICK